MSFISKKALRSPHFWVIAVLLVATTISHYHELLQNVPVVSHISVSVLFGVSRHTADRLIYVLLVAYSCWAFGTRPAIGLLVATLAAMLPRLIIISPSPADALVETLIAVLIGVLGISFIAARRKIREDRDKLRTAMSEMRSSEERYRELFQNASDAIWMHDLEGRMTVANKACEKMTGYTVNELLGRRVTEFLSQEAYHLAKEVKRRLLSGEPLDERYEQHIFRRDGTEAVMDLTTRLITEDGKPVAFHNIARDVTEEKRAEKALRESEVELSQIVDGSTVPIFVVNNLHVVTHWNRACENLTGVPATEVVGTSKQWKAFYRSERPVMADLVVDFVVDNVPEDLIARFYQGKYGKSALIEGAYEAEDFFPHIGDGGRWLFFTAAPIRDQEGRVFGAIETLQDITERKRIEQALKESE
ncbi:MAG: PAS domain S-box protein, partial [Chloroflexota bacterium]|nr:PAS domain S-box protein [Chloroflexota bacterium]